MVDYIKDDYELGTQRACGLIGLSKSSYYYQSHRICDADLTQKLKEKASERRRWGYRRLMVLLRREGIMDNHKRVFRIYSKEGLQVRKRKRRKQRPHRGFERNQPQHRNQRWSLDFMHDTISSGRRFRLLNIVDDFTRECLWIETDTSLSGDRVTRVLSNCVDRYGKPQAILTDNGPEFTGSTMEQWTYQNDITHQFIQPGKPSQNAYVESFNGRVRDECLNDHWFLGLWDAQEKIEQWRVDYNTLRPHGSLNQLSPHQFIANIAPPPGEDRKKLEHSLTNNNTTQRLEYST